MADRKSELMVMLKRWAGSLFSAFARSGLLQNYYKFHIHPLVRRYLPFLDPFITIEIVSNLEDSSGRLKSSDYYAEVKAYLNTACSGDAHELHAERPDGSDRFVLSLFDGEEVSDQFRGVTVQWSLMQLNDEHSAEPVQGKCICLTFYRRDWELIVNEYLPHVRRSGREVLFSSRRRRLYTNKKNPDDNSSTDEVWSYMNFERPTNFDALPMHPDKKQEVIDNLDNFCNRKDFYCRIGKPWKLDYLLYGPPGTGKSSLIAAMANHLSYDIYEIDLRMVHNNSDVLRLFNETTVKSIIVVKDIDCSVDLAGKWRAKWSLSGQEDLVGEQSSSRDGTASKVTLSGLLNVIDGLWSVCCSECVIVYTTNQVERLDPALIRRRSMDKHIEMSYCCYESFKVLARNLLAVDDHPLFEDVRALLQDVNITPADVGELLMRRCAAENEDSCLAALVKALRKARKTSTAKARRRHMHHPR